MSKSLFKRTVPAQSINIIRIVSFAHTAPWYTPELCLLKAKGHQLEHLYMRPGLIVHKEMFDHHISRHVQKGGLWGLKPLPFFKIIQKCPSQTNSNDIVVNKTKCILIIINMTMCSKR